MSIGRASSNSSRMEAILKPSSMRSVGALVPEVAEQGDSVFTKITGHVPAQQSPFDIFIANNPPPSDHCRYGAEITIDIGIQYQPIRRMDEIAHLIEIDRLRRKIPGRVNGTSRVSL